MFGKFRLKCQMRFFSPACIFRKIEYPFLTFVFGGGSLLGWKSWMHAHFFRISLERGGRRWAWKNSLFLFFTSQIWVGLKGLARFGLYKSSSRMTIQMWQFFFWLKDTLYANKLRSLKMSAIDARSLIRGNLVQDRVRLLKGQQLRGIVH